MIELPRSMSKFEIQFYSTTPAAEQRRFHEDWINRARNLSKIPKRNTQETRIKPDQNREGGETYQCTSSQSTADEQTSPTASSKNPDLGRVDPVIRIPHPAVRSRSRCRMERRTESRAWLQIRGTRGEGEGVRKTRKPSAVGGIYIYKRR